MEALGSELHEHTPETFLYVPAQVACSYAMKSATRSERVDDILNWPYPRATYVSRFSWNISLFFGSLCGYALSHALLRISDGKIACLQ